MERSQLLTNAFNRSIELRSVVLLVEVLIIVKAKRTIQSCLRQVLAGKKECRRTAIKSCSTRIATYDQQWHSKRS